MELWVRSQDRETLMKVNRIDIYGLSIITFNNDCEAIYLGRYETEKRALEVLDEIQDILVDYAKISRAVYQMPKE